jgi:hypothetical protein
VPLCEVGFIISATETESKPASPRASWRNHRARLFGVEMIFPSAMLADRLLAVTFVSVPDK